MTHATNLKIYRDMSTPSSSPLPASSTSAGDVSAVVVNYNGGKRVFNTIKALVDQATPLREIILADNQSTDGSPQRVKEAFPEVDILDMGGNPGPSAARSAGIRRASGEFVMLLDNDVYVEQDTIERLQSAYREHGQPTAVCPRIRLIPETDTVQAEGADTHFLTMMVLRHAYTAIDSLPMESMEVGGMISAGVLVHRERTLQAGAFDEFFSIYQEDLEFSMRLRLLGHRFVCEPRAVVNHDRGTIAGLTFRGDRESIKYPARKAYLQMRHRLLCILIHNRLRTILVLMPVLAVYELASIVLALLKGFGWQYLRAWGWIFGNLGVIFQRRRRMQRERTLADRDLFIGGPIPLTPGLVKGGLMGAAVGLLNGAFNAYWKLTHRLIG